jgi:hypothetical protein
MNKTATVSVLTANRLRDGIVVFLDFEGAWSETLAEAVLARSADEVRALQERGTYDAARNIVVEPYLIEVRETAGGLLPIRYRERVRAAGPSILEDVPGYGQPAAGHLEAQPEGGALGQARPELVEGHRIGGSPAARPPERGSTDGARAQAA